MLRRRLGAFCLVLGLAPGLAGSPSAAAEPIPSSEADISQFLPFDMPPYEQLVASEKKVFAHWHLYPISWFNKPADDDMYFRKVTDPESYFRQKARQRPLPRPPIEGDDWRVQDMMHEIRLAMAIGLDGFWFNHFGENNKNIDTMLEAASRVDSPFRILLANDVFEFNPESQAKREVPRDPVQIITERYRTLAKHPYAYRDEQGRTVLSGFGSMWVTPEQWRQIMDRLKDEEGIDTSLVALFMAWKDHYRDYAEVAEGFGDWGSKNYNGPLGLRGAAELAHQQGQIFIMPVAPQESRIKANFLHETRGTEMMRNGFEVAIEDGADWIQLVTWNDYGEATEFEPSIGTQYAYYDLAAYYITWFKTQRQPEIVRDVLYYFHRTQFLNRPTTAGKTLKVLGPPGEDIVELLAFLTEPGTLQIEIGDEVHTMDAPAGITSFQVPLAYGTPRFSLLRGGETVKDVTSAFPVLDLPIKASNPLYHAGSSSREPVEMSESYRRYYDQGVDSETDADEDADATSP